MQTFISNRDAALIVWALFGESMLMFTNKSWTCIEVLWIKACLGCSLLGGDVFMMGEYPVTKIESPCLSFMLVLLLQYQMYVCFCLSDGTSFLDVTFSVLLDYNRLFLIACKCYIVLFTSCKM